MLGRAQTRNAPTKGAAAKSVAAKRPSPWQGLWRQAGWGLAAATALGIAVLSSRDDDAPQRFAALFSSLRSQEQPAAHSFDAEAAARQLAQALRSLADDRDKLATRLNALDHEMRDMSGAIKQQIEAAKSEAIKTAKQAPPWPESAPPVPMTLADVAVMVKTVSPAPAGAAEPPSPSVATSATNSGRTCAARHDRLTRAGLRRRSRHGVNNEDPAPSLGVAPRRPSAAVRRHPAGGQRQTKSAHRPHGIAPYCRAVCERRDGRAILRFCRSVSRQLPTGDVRRQPAGLAE